MPTIDLDDVASIGSVRDVPPYMLPPEAWSLALNMRVVDKGLERLLGWEQVFGTPTVAPSFLMPVSTLSLQFWVYVSLLKAYVWDGAAHTDITRAAGNYTVTNGADWNGTLLGGVPILNNGADVPQFWAPTTVATKLQNLTNWQAAVRARVVRAFGSFLVAFGITDTGVVFPHLVRWSHPADPGSVPSSWDVTDPTKDTGQSDLPDVNAGIILDALPLGSTMYIYKESSTHKMNYIGGRSIMDFGQAAWLQTMGILAARCVAVTGDGLRHVVATQDDIIWHNGNSVDSILDKKQRRRLLNEIDPTNYTNSFMFDNPFYKEMWFCYPGTGQTQPDRALVMNYSNPGAWVVTEADGVTFRHAASGKVESPSEELWSDLPLEEWDTDTGPWSELLRRRVLLAGTAATKIYNMDKTVARDGVVFNATLQREGLSVLGQDRKGNWIVDHQIEKMLSRLWPKVQGGPINVRTGAQATVNGATSWGDVVAFDPSRELTADILPVTGRATSVEFSTTASVAWRIDGYKMEVSPVGDAGAILP